MRVKKLKAIISGLVGAVLVLSLSLVILTFTQEDQSKNVIEATSQTDTQDPAGIEVFEKTEVQEISQAEKHKSLREFDSFGIIEKKEAVEKPLVSQSPQKENKNEAEDELKSVEEFFKSDELSKLDELITDKQSELVKPVTQKKEVVEKVTEDLDEKKVASKSLRPGDKEIMPATEVPVSNKSVLEALISEGEALLNTSQADFERIWQKPTKAVWTDNIKTSARASELLRFNSVNSSETIFSFRQNKLSKISMMIFNKGDNEEVGERLFYEVVSEALLALQEQVGKKLLFKPNAGVARNNIHFAVKDGLLFKLEYSFTKSSKEFTGEYVRIVISKGNSSINVINIDKANVNVLTEAELRRMVSREINGDVLINGIPMVDQGQKGYCACAVLARLMTYFGRDIDQHDIAKLAGATASGTDPKLLKKAIESMSAKLRLNMKVLAKPYLASDRDSLRLQKKIGMDLRRISEGYELSLDPEVYKNLAFQDARYKEFEKNIINSIDRGRPVSWALLLGIVKEKDIPQASGGHMRIIIGYNKLEKKIYYTDTWGAGHEKKSADMECAFYTSLAVWEISPR